MMNEQKNINEQLLRDWAEMKKLQRPEYWAKMNRKVQEDCPTKTTDSFYNLCSPIYTACIGMLPLFSTRRFESCF